MKYQMVALSTHHFAIDLTRTDRSSRYSTAMAAESAILNLMQFATGSVYRVSRITSRTVIFARFTN